MLLSVFFFFLPPLPLLPQLVRRQQAAAEKGGERQSSAAPRSPLPLVLLHCISSPLQNTRRDNMTKSEDVKLLK